MQCGEVNFLNQKALIYDNANDSDVDSELDPEARGIGLDTHYDYDPDPEGWVPYLEYVENWGRGIAWDWRRG